MAKRYDLTEGPIITSLIKIAIPIIFANILQTAYQLTDTFWVGRLGSKAIAAVSISFPIIFLLISLGGGMAMAGTILVAQFTGKGDKQAVDHMTSQTSLLIWVISILLTIVGYFLSPVLIGLMHVEASVYVDAVSYMRITFSGIIFMFSSMVFQSLMRGVGDVKTPMYIILATVLLNLVLDPLFIFGYGVFPALGVGGAALASVGTQAIAAIIGYGILLRGKRQLHLHLRDLKPDFPLILKMFKIGLPASIEQSTRAAGMTAMVGLVATFGTLTLAAYGIGTRILSFVIIPALGLSMATSTLVGQNIGAGKVDRAEKITKLSAGAGFFVLTAIGIIMFVFAKQIATIFIPHETETIKTSAQFIKTMALTFGFIGIQMSLNGAFRGAGNTVIPMLLSIISLWILRFPLAYLLSHFTRLVELGIWLAFPIANIVAAIIALILYNRGSWKQKRITDEIILARGTTEEAMIEEGVNS